MERFAACSIRMTNYAGFEALEVANEVLSLTIIPNLGGKIVSLFDRVSNTEWMWKNPRLPFVAPDETTPYIRNLGGWDECFPTVCETTVDDLVWRTRLIRDHGEIWCVSWTYTVEERSSSISVHTIAQIPDLPCSFERSITIFENSAQVCLDYRVVNQLESELPFIWSCHPTLAASPGDSLILSPHPVILYDSFDKQFGPAGTSFFITEAPDVAGQVFDFSRLPASNQPMSLKLFTQKGVVDKIALKRISGAQLVFEVNPTQIPYFGIWLNFNAWSAEPSDEAAYCVAIEPCSSSTDDLSVARASHDNATIAARGSSEWQVSIRLEHTN